MLVVISDLHFEEEQSRDIEGPGPHPPIRISRNIRLNAFSKIFDRLSEQARRDGAHKMNLVLAGDIFELHRTALWFHCLLYTSPSPRDRQKSRMPSSA